MEITLTIENEKNLEVPQEMDGFFRSITEKLMEYEGIITTIEVSLTFVDNEQIRVLNAQHRGKDSATDVLSFPQYQALKDEEEVDEELYLGDVVISLEKAMEQAEAFGHSVGRELCYLYAHSILHLLGYDHETDEEKEEMRKLEEWVLTEVKMTRD